MPFFVNKVFIMKVLIYLVVAFCCISCGETVTQKTYQSPDKRWGDLFLDVQKKDIFEDSKTFADAVPKYAADTILEKYKNAKVGSGFDLKRFVEANFKLPNYSQKDNVSDLPFKQYLQKTLLSLEREPEDDGGSLIPTRKGYFVGGGKFEEFNYFRSYFVMQALLSIQQDTLALNQSINCAQFIQDFGHVPAGNRTYLMSRSNPPVFGLMIKKLAEKDPKQLDIFESQLTREYQYWMASETKEDAINQKKASQSGKKAFQKVVFLEGNNLLNRYYDKADGPRVEYFQQDNGDISFLKNSRTFSETEWPNTSRWLANSNKPSSLQTSDMLPIDLNALLYFTETTLSEIYKAKGKPEYAKSFASLAQKRKAIFNNYFWNGDKGFYFDFDFQSQKQKEVSTLAAVFPLFVGLADQNQADEVSKKIKRLFLKSGGLVDNVDGSEIGSAELQLIAIEALRKYGKHELAEKIKKNWLNTNQQYYTTNGRILASYNVNQPITPQKNPHQQRIDGSLSVLLILLNE
jgi:alpha,alpha-trehalase